MMESSTILKCAKVLSRSEQQKIFLVICIQIFLSVLDLVGVAIVGILGALAVRGVQSQQPGDRVSMVLKTLQIEDLNFQNQMIVLGFADSFFMPRHSSNPSICIPAPLLSRMWTMGNLCRMRSRICT